MLNLYTTVWKALEGFAENNDMILLRSEEIGADQGGIVLVDRKTMTTAAIRIVSRPHTPKPATPGQAYKQMLKEAEGTGDES